MRFINEPDTDLDCVYIRCKDKAECGRQECMHYVPFAKDYREERFLLLEWYLRYKKIKDNRLLHDFGFMAGHDGIELYDAYYYESYAVNYILIKRKSKYAWEKYSYPGIYIATIDLMKQHGFHITKAILRKYKRLKRKQTKYWLVGIEQKELSNKTMMEG